MPVDIINTAMSNMAASAGPAPALPPFLPPGPLPYNLHHRAGLTPANVKVRAMKLAFSLKEVPISAYTIYHKNLVGHLRTVFFIFLAFHLKL